MEIRILNCEKIPSVFPTGPAYTILSFKILHGYRTSFDRHWEFKLEIFSNILVLFFFWFYICSSSSSKFFLEAHSDSKDYHEFIAWYQTAPCNNSHNTFEEVLLLILRKVVSELFERPLKSTCHHVKMQRGGLQNFTPSGKNMPFFKSMIRIFIFTVFTAYMQEIL